MSAMATSDIPGLVRKYLVNSVPIQVSLGQLQPEAPLHGRPFYLDEIDVMELVQNVSEDLDIAVTFNEENVLNAQDATIQTAIDLFTKLHSEQHPG